MSDQITSADATLFLVISQLFPAPVQLQGFAVDDIYDTQPLKTGETQMGADGNLSGGFVYVPVEQKISLMADSDSMAIFDAWNAAEQVNRRKFTANAVILLPALGKKWAMTKGFLTTFQALPDAKRVLAARNFGITWQRVSPATTS